MEGFKLKSEGESYPLHFFFCSPSGLSCCTRHDLMLSVRSLEDVQGCLHYLVVLQWKSLEAEPVESTVSWKNCGVSLLVTVGPKATLGGKCYSQASSSLEEPINKIKNSSYIYIHIYVYIYSYIYTYIYLFSNVPHQEVNLCSNGQWTFLMDAFF